MAPASCARRKGLERQIDLCAFSGTHWLDEVSAMTDVTIREIQDLRELAEPLAPCPETEPDDAKAAGEELLADAHAMLARNRQLLASLKAKRG
jgi:hypothetical protein